MDTTYTNLKFSNVLLETVSRSFLIGFGVSTIIIEKHVAMQTSKTMKIIVSFNHYNKKDFDKKFTTYHYFFKSQKATEAFNSYGTNTNYLKRFTYLFLLTVTRIMIELCMLL